MALRRAATGLAQRLVGLGAEASPLAAETSLMGRFVLEGGSTPGCNAEAVRHASNQAVKQRIRAIKNIGKITKAMKMVAASKMRNAQTAMEQSRGIVEPFVRIFGDYPGLDPSKTVTVAVTSDKGLCGGLNSNITKYTKTLIKLTPPTEGVTAEKTVVTIGDKGRAQLTRALPDLYQLSLADTFKVRVTFAQSSLIAEELAQYSPDAYKILFNKFRSAISFKPTLATIMSPDLIEQQLSDPSGSKLDAYDIDATHERADVLQDLAEFQLAATLYNAMLENNCSEHASRMSAMENSTKSAGEMLSKLTLDYNRKRQASITTELIEIIAGASALVDAA